MKRMKTKRRKKMRGWRLVSRDRSLRKDGSGQIGGWEGRRGKTEGHPRPTNDGGSHREKGRGSKEGVGIQRSGKRGARWDGYRPDRAALEKWSEPE